MVLSNLQTIDIHFTYQSSANSQDDHFTLHRPINHFFHHLTLKRGGADDAARGWARTQDHQNTYWPLWPPGRSLGRFDLKSIRFYSVTCVLELKKWQPAWWKCENGVCSETRSSRSYDRIKLHKMPAFNLTKDLFVKAKIDQSLIRSLKGIIWCSLWCLVNSENDTCSTVTDFRQVSMWWHRTLDMAAKAVRVFTGSGQKLAI